MRNKDLKGGDEMKVRVEVTEESTYEVDIPDEVLNDREWIESFEKTFFDLGYSNEEAAIELACHIVHNHRGWRNNSFIEGVGHVMRDGKYYADAKGADPYVKQGFNITVVKQPEDDYDSKVV